MLHGYLTELSSRANFKTYLSLFLLLSLLPVSMVSPAVAAGVDIDVRIENGLEWVLGQEIDYLLGSRAFVSAVSTKPDKYRIYVDENSMAASAFAMYHKVYTSEKYDQKLRAALTFIMAAQTAEKDFYHYWNMTTRKWNHHGKLYYWNAYAVEGLAFSAFHMRLSATLESEKIIFNRAENAAAACIEEWHERSQQPDGRWIFSYSDAADHAEVDENGMILTALLYLALYERYWGDQENARTYTDWAEKTAVWILSRQEKDSSSWAYGGFYHDESESIQYTDSNGRAIFGLTAYLRTINSLTRQTEPTFSHVRSSIHVWADNFLLELFDSYWGISWYRTRSGITSYPKQVFRAAEVMKALIEAWIVLGDFKFQYYASRVYDWITGMNENSIDLQQALNRKSKGGGFYIGINANGSVEEESNLETTATATGAFIYGRWIAIPEFPNHAFSLLMLLTLIITLSASKYTKLRQSGLSSS